MANWNAFGIDIASQAGALEIDHQPGAVGLAIALRLCGPVAIGTTNIRNTNVF